MFDFEGLRSIGAGVVAGLLVFALSIFIRPTRKAAAAVVALAVTLLVIILWPRPLLVPVPDLTGLSRDEAQLVLSRINLIAQPTPQPSNQVRSGYVVPLSQNPVPGTRVHRQTPVRFVISTTEERPPSDRVVEGAIVVFAPQAGGTVVSRPGGDGIHRINIEGTVSGVDLTARPLRVWIRPVEPPSDIPGWYLQRGPASGIVSTAGDRWTAVAQLGNLQYPPYEGNIIEIAVTALPSEDALALDARQGPVVLGTLPGSPQSVVRSVRVTLR
jgi:hypothetical protein